MADVRDELINHLKPVIEEMLWRAWDRFNNNVELSVDHLRKDFKDYRVTLTLCLERKDAN